MKTQTQFPRLIMSSPLVRSVVQRSVRELVVALLVLTCCLLPGQLRADLTNGLIGYWSFDNGDGTDFSGNNLTAQPTNGPVATTGKVGGGMSFDGTDDYMFVPYNPLLNVSTGITVSLWLKANSWGSGFKAIMSRQHQTNNYSTFLLYSDSDNSLKFLLRAGFNDQRIVSVYTNCWLTNNPKNYDISGDFKILQEVDLRYKDKHVFIY